MSSAPSVTGYGSPVWVAEFDGAPGLPDTNTWDIVQRGPNYGNREVQTYTNSTSNVTKTGDGQLNITPQKDASGNWTSARLECKKSFACPEAGKMIMQARLKIGTAPSSQQAGVWPAFWTLGQSIREGVQWPTCGEWDIMENSSGQASTLASLHVGDANNDEVSVGGGGGPPQEVAIDVANFNTYSVTVDRTPTNWEDQTMVWSLNDKPWFTVHGSDCKDQTLWTNGACKAYFPILNVAIGTNFPNATNGGQPDSMTATGLGSGMQVSYVAVYTSAPKKDL